MFIVGIDLGTTASVVAYIDTDGCPKVVEVDGGKISTPSIVNYSEETPIIGREAILKADLAHTVCSVKRLMGTNTKSAGKNAVEVSGDILRHLKKITENKTNQKIDGAIITVPAHFSDIQRTATKQAASLAGIKVLRLINEPTAAAIAFGIDKQKNGIFAVYDFGGGTFDFSVLRLADGVFQVLATGGDNYLGGDDVDTAILDYNLQKWKLDKYSVSEKELVSLRLISQRLKEQLSEQDVISKQCMCGGKQYELVLTRDLLHDAMDGLVNKTIEVAHQVLSDAKITALDGVVLAGGMTRLQAVREIVKNTFHTRVYDDLNPESVVAIGAAIQADAVVNKNTNVLLIDVVPLTLGIETIGGGVDKIIYRNTPVPIIERREYTTYQNNQTAIKFHVVQGERTLAADCRSLAGFELSGIPPMPAGKPRVVVEFGVDVNGLLNLKAYEANLGIEQKITIEPSSGLSDDEMVSMLQDAYKNRNADAETEKNITIKIECARMIQFWMSLLDDLPEKSRCEARKLLSELKTALEMKSYVNAVKLKEALDGLFGQYLDDIISNRLSGKTITSIYRR